MPDRVRERRASAPRVTHPAARRPGTAPTRARPRHERRAPPPRRPTDADRDIRRKRPPALSFLLRMDDAAARPRASSRCWRSTSSASRSRSSPRSCSRKRSAGDRRPRRTRSTAPKQFLAVRLPADRAAVRALGPLRRARAAPRAVADRRLAVPGRVRRAALRRGQRRTLLQLLPVLWLARVRDLLRLLAARRATSARHAASLLRAAGYQRRAVLVGTRQAHRRRRPRARRRAALADRGRRLPLAEPAARPTACARSARSRTSTSVLAHATHRRGDHRRPRLPPGRCGGARRPVPPARRARAAGALDDGDPDPPRRVRARASRCRCSSSARRCSRASTSR